MRSCRNLDLGLPISRGFLISSFYGHSIALKGSNCSAPRLPMTDRTASLRPDRRGVQTPSGSQLLSFSAAIACCCTSAASTCSTERPFSISSRTYRECLKRRYGGVGWRKLKRARASNPQSRHNRGRQSAFLPRSFPGNRTRWRLHIAIPQSSATRRTFAITRKVDAARRYDSRNMIGRGRATIFPARRSRLPLTLESTLQSAGHSTLSLA